LDLSKKFDEDLHIKLRDGPLDLSRKTVTTNDQEDKKPHHLLGQTRQYRMPMSHSYVPSTQSKWQQNIHSNLVNPKNMMSALAASMLPMSTTLVQKVSPVQLQNYICTLGKQLDSATKTCVIAATPQRFSHPESLSGSRNISVVKPAASSISHPVTQLLAASVEPAVIHTNQKASPRYGTVIPSSFDTGRTDRGLPLAQVYPSRVVTSTAHNTLTETVPSPVHGNKELLRKSPSRLLDKNCPTVCAASTSSITKVSSSHVETVAALSLDNCNTVRSPTSVPTTSTDVSPQMPILSPNVSSSGFLNHTVSPEPCPTKWTSSKGILPPVETSPVSLSDRESISDEYDSGHELFSTHMEWDDNSMSDTKDFVSNVSHTEESSVKRPAFEVVCDCNRTLLSDISCPCYAAVAFDRSLLQNKSARRDFIARTKYYRFFTRRSNNVGSGPHSHDLDVVQLDKSYSPSASSSSSQELRLPVQLFSALKGSPTRKSKSGAALRQNTFLDGGKDGNLKDAGHISSTYSLKSNCKYGLLDKKVGKLHLQKVPSDDSVSYNIIGSVYSIAPTNSSKGGSRDDHSDSGVQVKSELIEASASPKPVVHTRIVYRRRKKSIPTEMYSGSFSSSDKIVDNTNETNNSDSVDTCSRLSDHSDLTEVSESSNKVGCKQDLLQESAVVNSSLNTGRKNPHDRVPGVRQRKLGSASNSQGKTVEALPTSSSTTSVSSPEHLNDVHQLDKSETSSADGSESVPRTAEVSVYTRANTASTKADITTTYSRCQMTSKPQRMCSDSKPKQPRRSADVVVAALLSNKSVETVSRRNFIASDINRQKFHSLRQSNRCTKEQSVAKTDTAAKDTKSDTSIASDASDAQNKAQRSILKQLESSEGYIAEKNIKYSKSEDLFDDSSLLSREQRALRVSSVQCYNWHHCCYNL